VANGFNDRRFDHPFRRLPGRANPHFLGLDHCQAGLIRPNFLTLHPNLIPAGGIGNAGVGVEAQTIDPFQSHVHIIRAQPILTQQPHRITQGKRLVQSQIGFQTLTVRLAKTLPPVADLIQPRHWAAWCQVQDSVNRHRRQQHDQDHLQKAA